MTKSPAAPIMRRPGTTAPSREPFAALSPLASSRLPAVAGETPVSASSSWPGPAALIASPFSNPFILNNLDVFPVGPPHLSPLFSIICRFWGGGPPPSQFFTSTIKPPTRRHPAHVKESAKESSSSPTGESPRSTLHIRHTHGTPLQKVRQCNSIPFGK